MYGDRGINLINIECKREAFLALHVCNFLFGGYIKSYEFAMCWLKTDLTKYLSSAIQINFLPLGDVKSVFYDKAISYFKELMSHNIDLDLRQSQSQIGVLRPV